MRTLLFIAIVGLVVQGALAQSSIRSYSSFPGRSGPAPAASTGAYTYSAQERAMNLYGFANSVGSQGNHSHQPDILPFSGNGFTPPPCTNDREVNTLGTMYPCGGRYKRTVEGAYHD